MTFCFEKLKLIILDRDGVINKDSPDYIKSPEEWHPIPDSLTAIAKLNKAKLKVAVATNQSGVGRGYYDLNTLKAIHEKMIHMLASVEGHLDLIEYCPHHPDEECECRKPKPGMLYKIGQILKIPLKEAVMIGDSKRDIEAALSAGAHAIYIQKSSVPFHKQIITGKEIFTFSDLNQAVDAILKHHAIFNF